MSRTRGPQGIVLAIVAIIPARSHHVAATEASLGPRRPSTMMPARRGAGPPRAVGRIAVCGHLRRAHRRRWCRGGGGGRPHDDVPGPTRERAPTGWRRRPPAPTPSVVVNVQGDEPMLPPDAVDRAAVGRCCEGVAPGSSSSTLSRPPRTRRRCCRPRRQGRGGVLAEAFVLRAPLLAHARPGPARGRDAARARRRRLAHVGRKHVGLYEGRRETPRRWLALPHPPLERAPKGGAARALGHALPRPSRSVVEAAGGRYGGGSPGAGNPATWNGPRRTAEPERCPVLPRRPSTSS